MVSLTLPITDNASPDIVLGFMTVLASAASLLDVTSARAGLSKTGTVLLVSTSRHENLFRYEQRPSNPNAQPPYQPGKGVIDYARVKFVFPPRPNVNQTDRHIAYK